MNQILLALYNEDRSDAQNYRAEESFLASQARLAHLIVRLAQDNQMLQTASDYYHACILFQHGEQLEHYLQANQYARKAAELGLYNACYMVAASYDRYLMRQGKPQKYGTNSIYNGRQWSIWNYDPTTTDTERAEWNVPPLAELLARTIQMNQDTPANNYWVAPIATITSATQTINLYDLEQPPPPVGHLPPPYHPIETAGVSFSSLFPSDTTFWRFGQAYCAKTVTGRLFLTWHPCRPQPSATDVQVWLTLSENFWHRLVVISNEGQGWLLGSSLPPAQLLVVAHQLVR